MKLEEIDFRLKLSLSCSDEHHLTYRDDRAGVQMDIHTPVKKSQHPQDIYPRFGKERRVFSIDGDDRTFENVEDFQKVVATIDIPDVGEAEVSDET